MWLNVHKAKFCGDKKRRRFAGSSTKLTLGPRFIPMARGAAGTI